MAEPAVSNTEKKDNEAVKGSVVDAKTTSVVSEKERNDASKEANIDVDDSASDSSENEVEEDDDEDEEEDEGPSRKRRRKDSGGQGGSKRSKSVASALFDDEASEEDEEDAEALERERKKQQREEENESEELKEQRRNMEKRLLERQKQKDAYKNVSLEDQVDDIKARHAQQRREERLWRKAGKKSNLQLQRGQHLPTPQDPKLFAVKCMTGKERQFALQLLNKASAFTRQNKRVPVFSCTASKTRGYIYVEAYNKADVTSFIRGIAGIFMANVQQVPLQEMTAIYRITKKKNVLKRGQWVRMKRGVYRGDIGMVMTDPDPQDRIVLRLIPRLDLVQSQQPKHLYMKDYLRNALQDYLEEVKLDDEAVQKAQDAMGSLDAQPRPTLGWCKRIYYKDDPQEDKEFSLVSFWEKGEKEYIAQRQRDKNFGSRPAAKFFDITEIESIYGAGEIPPADRMCAMDEMRLYEHSSTGRKFINDFTRFKSEYFKDGFLYKRRVNTTAVDVDVKPTLEERARFESQTNQARKERMADGDRNAEDEEDIENLGEGGAGFSSAEALANSSKNALINPLQATIPFEAGDTVRITASDLKNVICKIVSIDIEQKTAKLRPTSIEIPGIDTITQNLDHIEKYFSTGMHVKVLNGRYRGDTGTVVNVEQVGNKVEATILNDSQTREMRVFVTDIQESTDVSTDLNTLQGYKMYDLIQVGVGGQRGIIVKITRESLDMLNQRGVIVTVKPEEISRTLNKVSQNAQAVTVDRQYITQGDVVSVIAGKHKGARGTVKHMTNNSLFLHSRDRIENAGVFVVMARDVKLAGYASNKDLTALSKGLITNASAGQPAIFRGKSGRRNLNKLSQTKKDEYKIGKSVQIIKGFWKGKIGIIVDGTLTHRDIELHARNKTVTVRVGDIQDVIEQGRNVFMNNSNQGQQFTASQQTPYFGGGITPAYGSNMMTPNFSMAGVMTPGAEVGNEGDWSTPNVRTPSATPMMQNNYDDGSMMMGGMPGYNNGMNQQWGQQQAPPSSGWGNNSVAGSNYGQPQPYGNGANNYNQPEVGSMSGQFGPPSTVGGYNSEVSGYSSDMNNQGFASSASSIGAHTPSTPGQGAVDDVDDEDAWGIPSNANVFAGLLLKLKSDPSIELELISSLLDQRRMHKVRYLKDGREENMHESMLTICEPKKNDRIVVVKGGECGDRGKIINLEDEDYIVQVDGAGDTVNIYEGKHIGKLASR